MIFLCIKKAIITSILKMKVRKKVSQVENPSFPDPVQRLFN